MLDTTELEVVGSVKASDAVTILIPTRNEAENVAELVARIHKAVVGSNTTIVFIDDSDDDTTSVIKQVRVNYRGRLRIQIIHRSPEHRVGGLSGAVVEGMMAAESPYAVVMDADLQHPPEVIPQLLEQATAQQSDLVVASRYQEGGQADGLSLLRKTISRGSTISARMLFQKHLSSISDPMSGFFLIRLDAVKVSDLKPRGFKILLEIAVRGESPMAISEVAYHFTDRHAGSSKGSFREGFNFLLHMRDLRRSESRKAIYAN